MKLSIITINYNNRAGLENTIDSIISQTWHDFEWIVIDGGSIDGSKELIEQYQEHFAYWCSEPDRGIYHAMNKGISHASGVYSLYMNSGDVFFEKETLAKVFIKERNADLLYGDWMRVGENFSQFTHYEFPVEIYPIYRGWNFCQQALFIKTQILLNKGFDETYRVGGDTKRWVEAMLDNNSFEYMNIVVCNFDLTGISSTNNEVRLAERERTKKEVYPAPVLRSLDRLYDYENKLNDYKWDGYVQIVRILIAKGGFVKCLTSFILLSLNKLFGHYKTH